MTCYVDALLDRGWKLRGRAVRSCHLLADGEEELHEMAKAIGMKPEWFQPRSHPHYDLTESRREKAVRLGARQVGRSELVQLLRKARSA